MTAGGGCVGSMNYVDYLMLLYHPFGGKIGGEEGCIGIHCPNDAEITQKDKRQNCKFGVTKERTG